MYRRDYLVKQFEAFGKALALLVGQRQRQALEEYEKTLAEVTQTYAGKSPTELKNLSSEAFETLIDESDLVRKKIVAALLFEVYHHITENSERQSIIGKRCLRLYQTIQNDLSSGEFDLDVYYKIQFLKEHLN